MLEVAIEQHQPQMVNGRRIKLRYAHQGGQNPSVIIVHGKQATKVPKSHQRFLVNDFTKALQLFGTPLCIEFRQRTLLARLMLCLNRETLPRERESASSPSAARIAVMRL